MSMYFSASNIGFYDDTIKSSYEAAGTWPSDAVLITNEEYQEYLSTPPAGKKLGSDSSGHPAWVDLPEKSAEEIYASLISTIQLNAENAAKSVKRPYSDEEVQTWWCQLEEAHEYTANPSYEPVMINAMVSASGGGWTLSSLVANIISNGNEWRTAAGNILGQVKARTVAINTVKAEVDAGTKTIADLQALDCTITTPTVNLEDKFS